MKPKYENIVIDTNNLFWRASHKAFKDYVSTKDNRKIYKDIVKNFFERVKFCEDMYGTENVRVFFLFDNPTSKVTEREQISGGQYKHLRKSKQVPENFYSTLKLMEELLKNYSDLYYVAWGEKLEADDLTLPIKNVIAPNANNRILFVSNDMDWARNISDFSHWYDWKTLFDHDTFFKHFGYVPDAETVKLYKTLMGDKSDNIPKPFPIPEKAVLELVNKYKSYETLRNSLSEIEEELRNKLHFNRAALDMNYNLVTFIPYEGNISEILVNGKRNPTKIRVWYKALNLPLEKWMEPIDSLDTFFSKRKK